MENPDFFSEGLMKEPLSEKDMSTIAEAAGAIAKDGQIYFSNKGVYTTFVFNEEKQRFEFNASHDAASENDDAFTHQSSPALESADDINATRAEALADALKEFRDPSVLEE